MFLSPDLWVCLYYSNVTCETDDWSLHFEYWTASDNSIFESLPTAFASDKENKPVQSPD